LEGRTRSPN